MATDIRYRTTRPIVPRQKDYPVIETSRPGLMLRSPQTFDLHELHELRSQMEVMVWTSKGTVDADLDETRVWMNRFLDPASDVERTGQGNEAGLLMPELPNFNFIVTYRNTSCDDEDKDGEAVMDRVIGMLGCHRLEPDAEVGYMIRKEYWGRGLVSAALQAYLKVWWELPRKTVTIAAADADRWPRNKVKIADNGGDQSLACEFHVNEVMTADLVKENVASRRILEKCGFTFVREELVGENEGTVMLMHYVLQRPQE